MFVTAGDEVDTEALPELLRAVAAADVGSCDAAGLTTMTGMVRRLQGFLDARCAAIAQRAAVLHAAGAGAAPVEVLAAAGRMGMREANRIAQRAETLAESPAMSAALSSGTITGAHADAMVNATAKLPSDARAGVIARDAELARHAARVTPEDFGRHCRRLADRIAGDDGLSRVERQRRDTRLSRWIDDITGMYRLEGRFDPETGHRIFTALESEIDALRASSNNSAVVEELATENGHLVAHALARLVSTGHRERRPGVSELCVHIDDETLRRGLHDHGVCELSDGTPIPIGVARRLACEAKVFPIVYGGDSDVLDAGRDARMANRAQRRALRKMYRHCAWHGCDVRFDWCHIHHVVPWTDGGATDLVNLVPLCTRHHHLVHEGRWAIHLGRERTLHITRPDGALHASVPLEANRPPTRRGGGGGRPPDGRARPHRNAPPPSQQESALTLV